MYDNEDVCKILLSIPAFTRRAKEVCKQLLCLETDHIDKCLEQLEIKCGRTSLVKAISTCEMILSCVERGEKNLTSNLLLAFIVTSLASYLIILVTSWSFRGIYIPIQLALITLVYFVYVFVYKKVLKVEYGGYLYTIFWDKDPPLCGVKILSFVDALLGFMRSIVAGLFVYSLFAILGSLIYTFVGKLALEATGVFGRLCFTASILAYSFSFISATLFVTLMLVPLVVHGVFSFLVGGSGETPFITPEIEPVITRTFEPIAVVIFLSLACTNILQAFSMNLPLIVSSSYNIDVTTFWSIALTLGLAIAATIAILNPRVLGRWGDTLLKWLKLVWLLPIVSAIAIYVIFALEVLSTCVMIILTKIPILILLLAIPLIAWKCVESRYNEIAILLKLSASAG